MLAGFGARQREDSLIPLVGDDTRHYLTDVSAYSVKQRGVELTTERSTKTYITRLMPRAGGWILNRQVRGFEDMKALARGRRWLTGQFLVEWDLRQHESHQHAC